MLPIVTERLVIRRMAVTDLRDFLRFNTHPTNREYQAVVPFTEETGVGYLERQSTFEPGDAGGWMGFAVELRQEARMIGEVGIFLPKEPRSKGDVGWTFHPDYHGQGYATEAARVLLTYAFDELKLHRVTAGCDTRNTASVRLMERLGMRREGHSLQSTFLQGAWRDDYSYALLREEWIAQENKSTSLPRA
jgi:RimJ/RimL family protein N-acetyltransferase